MLFYLPTMIWHGLNSKAGVDADSILAAAHTFTRLDDGEGSEKMLRMLVRQMDRFLSSRQPAAQQRCSCADCVKDGCQLCGRRLLYTFLISLSTTRGVAMTKNVGWTHLAIMQSEPIKGVWRAGWYFLVAGVLATRPRSHSTVQRLGLNPRFLITSPST